MKLKKLFMLLVLIIVASIITACGGSGETDSTSSEGNTEEENNNSSSEEASGASEHVIKLGHVTREDTAYAIGVKKFAELVEEKTDGEVTVEIYPNGELGSNPELLEQLQQGTIGAMIPSVAILSAFTDKTLMLDLPYLFKNNEVAEHILDGPIGTEILESVEDSGIIGVGWFDQGWRHLFANEKVEKPADMEGLKFRILETPVHVDFMKSLGASGTNIAFTELFTALEQGVVDGAENPYTNIYLNGYAEVSPYITESQHIYDALPMLISKVVWDKLSEEQQEEVREAAQEASDFERDLVIEKDEEIKQEILESGENEIVELTDEERAEFAEIVRDALYDKWAPEIGDDLLQRTLDAQEEYFNNQ
ncbi:TRAP transporter substrate-binding protein [Virgibacillus sp. W0181]|uniref:TRAP transporter substrate-binding protein n=1 Tax=Virgibacillus sp. W0181 TaxID=3391581 RepID=UPI003F450FE3